MANKMESQPVKKKEDAVVELEQQFLLRMPRATSMALHHDVEMGSISLRDKLSIEINMDNHGGRVAYGGQIYNAKMVDLPCVVECLKTTDNKTFYKTANISQMLVAHLPNETIKVDEVLGKDGRDKKLQYPHGVTPPLKNVRKRRFRKTLKKKNSEMPDIENEVKRLLRMDNEAIDVKWEVVIEEDQPADPATADKHVLMQGETHKTLRNLKRKSLLELPDLGDEMELSLFGEISDDSDNANDDDQLNQGSMNKDIMKEATKQIFGDVSDDSDDEEIDLSLLEAQGEALSIATSELPEGDAAGPSSETDLQLQCEVLASQVQSLQERKLQKELEYNSCADQAFKDHLQFEISSINHEEQKKQTELEIVRSMLNQD